MQYKATGKEGDNMKPEPMSEEWKYVISYRNKWLKKVPIYDSIPEEWHIVNGTLTQPRGTVWIATGSFFSHDRKHALMWL